jgi:acetylornithine deacetylase/succinyl-diaminopimelate desuccinylase-like protein
MKKRPRIEREILVRTRCAGFRNYLKTLLVELCLVDTAPSPVIRKMREAENRCFDILERELGALKFPATRCERRPINPAIKQHPSYSLLHFTKTPQRPHGLSAEETYRGRSNLVCFVPGASRFEKRGKSVAMNAHIDVVAPYFPPLVQGGTVYGRGACDDKGPVVSVVAALKVLSEVMDKFGLHWNRNVLAMFVVEEETGGNGSLSLAIDHKLKRHYDSVLVGECTGLKIYPANRGAVWYRAELRPPRGISPFEMFAFMNEEMEREGTAIRAESHHPLFPQRPVQTCHGIIGPFGEHPSRICGHVQFQVRCRRPPGTAFEQLLRDCLEAGLAEYVGRYGDKTKVIDPATGKQMVARHYDLKRQGKAFEVDVFGATGHMGAIRERDGAITKMAHLVRYLVCSRERLEALAGGPVTLELAGAGKEATLVCEGGQGFVPTHEIDEVMERLRQAAARGADNYLRRAGQAGRGAQSVKLSYEKLHNVAFDGDPKSVSMRNALAVANSCGLPDQEPVLGWTVSCDARLFATEYPGMDVLTFGPGKLVHAHSDEEQIELDDLQQAVEFLALFLLRQTGTAVDHGK